MVEITSVGSLYLDVNSKSGYELTWNPSFSGQTHYEILYTFNKNDTWLTAGKVASTSAKSYDLRKLYEIVDIDFVEVFYKVRVYYSRTNDNGDLETGTEDSNIFSIIFNQGYSSELNVWNEEKKSFPMFQTVKNDNIPFLSVNVDGTTERVPLVEKSSPIAGDLHIEVDNSERVLAKSSGYFAPNPIGANDSFGYFNVKSYKAGDKITDSKEYTYSSQESYKTYYYYYYKDWWYNYRQDWNYYYSFNSGYYYINTYSTYSYISSTYYYSQITGYGYGDRYGTYTFYYYYWAPGANYAYNYYISKTTSSQYYYYNRDTYYYYYSNIYYYNTRASNSRYYLYYVYHNDTMYYTRYTASYYYYYNYYTK